MPGIELVIPGLLEKERERQTDRHKAIPFKFTWLLSQHLMLGHQMALPWRADDGPLLWYLNPLSPHQLKLHWIFFYVKTFWICAC